jgi:hypothetical protein
MVRWFEQVLDGATIIEALTAALEDANYQTLAGRIEDLWRQDAADDDEGDPSSPGQRSHDR